MRFKVVQSDKYVQADGLLIFSGHLTAEKGSTGQPVGGVNEGKSRDTA